MRATVALAGARRAGRYLRARVLLGSRVVATSRKLSLTAPSGCGSWLPEAALLAITQPR